MMLVADLMEALGAPHSKFYDSLPASYNGGFWLHPGSGRVVTTDAGWHRDEHVHAVLAHPDWFGLDPATVSPDEQGEAFNAAMANGWIRATFWGGIQELNLDAITVREGRMALRVVLQNRPVEALYLHVLRDPGPTSVVIEGGDAVDRFARTGAVPRAA